MMQEVYWSDTTSILLINSRYPTEEKVRLHAILEQGTHFPGHIWLSTSGSTAAKWVGLTRSALLASAQAVNTHLQSSSRDCWIAALPPFHVGGIGIWARAHLTGAAVCDFYTEENGRWSPQRFCERLSQVGGTLTSLVPAQLHDLIQARLTCPDSLRAVIIGGDCLAPALYQAAVDLNWPVLPSYGLTECASQVATASLDSWKAKDFPALKILSHMQVQVQGERLAFRGPSLVSTYAYIDGTRVQFIDPKRDGWFVSEDRGKIFEDRLEVLGRCHQVIKIGGEKVDLACLQMRLQTLRLNLNLSDEVILVAVPDDRLGHILHLVVAGRQKSEEVNCLKEHFNASVLPFERIRQTRMIPHMPKSALGKILMRDLEDMCL